MQIVSLTTSTNNQAVVVFFVLDRGEVLVGVTLATILNRVQVNQMSSMLGVEVRQLFPFNKPNDKRLPTYVSQCLNLNLMNFNCKNPVQDFCVSCLEIIDTFKTVF